jgi:hypothetical protein
MIITLFDARLHTVMIVACGNLSMVLVMSRSVMVVSACESLPSECSVCKMFGEGRQCLICESMSVYV